MAHTMPREVYDKLSPHGQLTCRYIVADMDEEIATGYRQSAEAQGGFEKAAYETMQSLEVQGAKL